MSQKIKTGAIIFAIVAFLVITFGVYATPFIPAYKKLSDDAIANQIASMNYMLTFIGVVGAITGIGFTIFGYYQSKSFPEIIEEKVENEVNKRLETARREYLLEKENYEKLIEEVEEQKKRLESYCSRFINDRGYVLNVNLQDVKEGSIIHTERVSVKGEGNALNFRDSDIKIDHVMGSFTFKECKKIQVDHLKGNAFLQDNKKVKINHITGHGISAEQIKSLNIINCPEDITFKEIMEGKGVHKNPKEFHELIADALGTAEENSEGAFISIIDQVPD